MGKFFFVCDVVPSIANLEMMPGKGGFGGNKHEWSR